MASVSINEGMPRPEAPAMGLPRARWKLLAMARRRWAEVELPFDCRLLRTVVDEAPLLAEELGLGSGEEFLRDYLTLDLDLVQRVLGWLEQEQPTEAVPLQLVIEQAKAQPLAAHGEIGNGRKDESRVDNINSTEAKGGTSASYLLRRIARDQPAPAPALHPLAVLALDLEALPAVTLRTMAGTRSKRHRKHQLVALVAACC